MTRRLTYATFCSGIECMSASCNGLPLDPIFFSEIEPFPCAVLKSHFPTIPNLGDMSKIRRDENGNITNGIITIPFPSGGIDILAAGCPCQDFSIAGKRAGGEENSGTRSSLVFEFIRIINEIQPRYFIYENVPGMFTTNQGRDFAHILLAFRDIGYGCAWRVLDAQYVRVDGMERAIPQRRRRVWVVGCAGGDVAKAAQILFENKGVAGDNPPRRRTGQEIAAASRGRNRLHDAVVGGASGDGETIALDGDKLKTRTDQRKGGNGFGINEDGVGYTLTGVDRHGVAYGIDQQGGKGGANTTENVAPTVLSDSHGTPHGVAYAADGGEVAATITRQIAEQSGQDNRANSVVHCYENHAQDSRVRPIEVVPTIPQRAGTGGNNLPLAVFNKVSHPHGKDGEGERWDSGEVASTRNVFDISETRTQECVVHATNSNGVELFTPSLTVECAPTLKHGTGDHVAAVCYDGYNQAGKEECCHTLGTCNSESPNNDKVVKVTIKQSFGINPQGGQMLPFDKELGETLAIGHQGGVMTEQDIAQMKYIVRRLTPRECERLMGLPDGWTIPKNLEVTDALVAEFQRVHDTYGAIMYEYAKASYERNHREGEPPPKPPKPKSAAWVRKWLEKITNPDTCPDAPRYKGAGNGWATNQPRWILLRLLAAEGIDPWWGEFDEAKEAKENSNVGDN